MSLSPKGKAQVSDPPKSRCLQLVHVTELPAGVPEDSLPEVPGKGSPGIAHYIWMRELGSPAWCRCVLGTPSLSRLLAAVGADGQTQGSASPAGGAALLRRRRRRMRSLGAEAAAVLCPLHQPSLPSTAPVCSMWMLFHSPLWGWRSCSALPSECKAWDEQWRLPRCSGWLCCGCCPGAGSVPGCPPRGQSHREQRAGTLSTAELCSHSEVLWGTENEELTLSWLRQQQPLPGAVSHTAAGMCFVQFFPSPCFSLAMSCASFLFSPCCLWVKQLRYKLSCN